MPARRYAFTWDLIGDIRLGRPNLGNTTRIEMYRLLQYTLRDVLEARYGTEEADRIFYEAGFLAGEQFCHRYIGEHADIDGFLAKVQEMMQSMNIGILRMEESNADHTMLTMSVAEDLDCSGLPDIDHEVCTYDEGFIAGLLHAHTGESFTVKETECWCTGDRTCRFEVIKQA